MDNWFTKAFTTKDIINPQTYDPRKEGDGYWHPDVTFQNMFNGSKFLQDYIEVPEVANIINNRARAMASCMLAEAIKGSDEPINTVSPLLNILNNPNWYQAYTEFWRHSEVLRALTGNEYLYFNRPYGMPDEFLGLFSLDDAQISVKYSGDKKRFTEGDDSGVKYEYKDDDGYTSELIKDNLIHLNDNRVGSDNFLKGLSKLKALQPNIENIRKAYRKRGIVLDLAVGVFSQPESDGIGQGLPFDPEQEKALKDKLRRNKDNAIVTPMNLKYASLNNEPKKMGLFDEVKEDTMRICDAFGYDYDLLSNDSNGGLSDGGMKQREIKKQMYEEHIIPDVQEKIRAINNKFNQDNNTEIVAQWKHLAVFSEDIKQRATAFKLMADSVSKLVQVGIWDSTRAKEELDKLENK